MQIEQIPDWLVELAEKNDEVRRRLLIAHRHPEFLERLISRYQSSCTKTTTSSNFLKLGAKAAAAYAKWAANGFVRTPQDLYQKRISACNTCPELSKAPSSGAWVFLMKDETICGKCGCPISRKAAMVTEKCPLPSQDSSSISRWGDSIY
jgi:hypothetical protein